MALRRSSTARKLRAKKTYVLKAISKAISGAEKRYLLCRCAMLCRVIGALASENDTAGFELPIRKLCESC